MRTPRLGLLLVALFLWTGGCGTADGPDPAPGGDADVPPAAPDAMGDAAADTGPDDTAEPQDAPTPLQGFHPCQVVMEPGGSHDADVNACVCDDLGAAECCDMGWIMDCVFLAQDMCGVTCDGCSDLPTDERSCVSDADCGHCNDGEPCNGTWACVGSEADCLHQPIPGCGP